jgi:hypothetical protein
VTDSSEAVRRMEVGSCLEVIILGYNKIPETINSSSLVTLCCIDCPLYIVVSCLGCAVVSFLVCTVVVVLSVLLSSYV